MYPVIVTVSCDWEAVGAHLEVTRSISAGPLVVVIAVVVVVVDVHALLPMLKQRRTVFRDASSATPEHLI